MVEFVEGYRPNCVNFYSCGHICADSMRNIKDAIKFVLLRFCPFCNAKINNNREKVIGCRMCNIRQAWRLEQ